MKREIITMENGIVCIPQSVEIWMTHHELADLFGCFVAKVNSNIRSILKSGLLRESEVCRMFHYQNGSFIEVYGLEMIIALSFRIKSRNAEIFREWLPRKLTKAEIPEMLIRFTQNPMLN
ncbi:MAG: protein-tyrosine kinase [Bacteroidales bacterium]|nr:protein-tyrosine kinase [Bacteroidales bacterium]MCC8173006.1 protein-tyrosine kinase [Odoribacter sp.]